MFPVAHDLIDLGFGLGWGDAGRLVVILGMVYALTTQLYRNAMEPPERLGIELGMLCQLLHVVLCLGGVYRSLGHVHVIFEPYPPIQLEVGHILLEISRGFCNSLHHIVHQSGQ